MQNLNDMIFFAEVVDRGGFTAASRSLSVPKSRLSRRISDLESRLGVRLLQRTTRKLSLTEAGEIYYRHCVALREEAEAADEAIAHAQSEPRGTVRITCPVTLAQTILGPILPRFVAMHPQVRIELQVTNRVVDLVHEGVDVALRVRPNLEDSGSLVVKNLGATYSVLLASPKLLDRLGKPGLIEELHRLPTLAMSALDGRTSWCLVGPDGEKFELHHRPVCTADDMLVLKSAALEGIGMALLPDFMCSDEISQGLLLPVLEGWSPPALKVLAVFPTRRGMMPAVRSFLDFLAENVTGEKIMLQEK
ncbi:LysR substrate-binding domain-containing protein [Pseudomonas sp. CFBP 13602]|uniref:LysR substrate-binding domain-containing protein n=1 Tax=Pseudomonas sp. CFBP 13602 TaxID=2774039 RepID=UPI00177D1BA3|nr:LysR substrate-binding domain-containing protein [Pseudomonas sp. CFBP 13602]MBD8828558.1 LysR family transcriptional regulator [Pseudomonas sp. CFBP 13602]